MRKQFVKRRGLTVEEALSRPYKVADCGGQGRISVPKCLMGKVVKLFITEYDDIEKVFKYRTTVRGMEAIEHG